MGEALPKGREAGVSVSAGQGSASGAEPRPKLLALVLDGVTSEFSRRSCRTSLLRFLLWTRASALVPTHRHTRLAREWPQTCECSKFVMRGATNQIG